MRAQLLCVLAFSLFLGGCVSGGSYPTQRARTYCDSLFSCVDEAEIEFWTRYDDIQECVDEQADSFEDSADYQRFIDGECEFDAESADACLEEISEVKNDNDCDGNMSFLAFSFDSIDQNCGDVYCD